MSSIPLRHHYYQSLTNLFSHLKKHDVLGVCAWSCPVCMKQDFLPPISEIQHYLSKQSYTK